MLVLVRVLSIGFDHNFIILIKIATTHHYFLENIFNELVEYIQINETY